MAGQRIRRQIGRSDGILDGLAAFGRSVGELDGRSANQAANWTVGRRIGRYSEDVKDKRHERLSPSQFQASRPEYKVFEGKMFRHRIYQEI
jgi:hypothetical protein